MEAIAILSGRNTLVKQFNKRLCTKNLFLASSISSQHELRGTWGITAVNIHPIKYMNVLCYLDERITNINIQKTGTAMTNIILFTIDSQTFKLSASTVIANSGLHRVGILNFQMKVEVVAMLSIFFSF